MDNKLREDFEYANGDQLYDTCPPGRWIAYAKWLERKLSEEAIAEALKLVYYEHNGKVYRNDKKDIIGFREFARVIRDAVYYPQFKENGSNK